jgi:methylthioribose-1-phosphate isomerase
MALEASPPPEFLASAQNLKTHVEEILSFLATARPTAVNLSAATTRLSKTLHSFNDKTDIRIIAKELISEANLIADEDVGRNKEMSRYGAEWLFHHYQGNIDSGLNVLTVCNTGSLATSASFDTLSLLLPVHQSNAGIWDSVGLDHISPRVRKIEQSILYTNGTLSSGLKVKYRAAVERQSAHIS